MDRLRPHFARNPHADAYVDVYESKYPVYMKLAKQVEPKAILEIGVQWGFSMLAMMYAHRPNAVFLIDGEHDGVPLRDTVRVIQTEFPMVPIWYCVVDTQIAPVRPDEEVDIVHIDACHTYEGCRNDLANYGDLARRLIIVDDTHSPDLQRAALEYARAEGLRIEELTHSDGGIAVWKGEQ